MKRREGEELERRMDRQTARRATRSGAARARGSNTQRTSRETSRDRSGLKIPDGDGVPPPLSRRLEPAAGATAPATAFKLSGSIRIGSGRALPGPGRSDGESAPAAALVSSAARREPGVLSRALAAMRAHRYCTT